MILDIEIGLNVCYLRTEATDGEVFFYHGHNQRRNRLFQHKDLKNNESHITYVSIFTD